MSVRVKVTSPSFSQNPELRAETLALFPGAVFNDAGKRLSGAALAEYLADADAAIVGLELVTRALIEACPRLRIVARYGVGVDNIDADACAEHRVAIGWSGGVNRRSVSELALCFMLGLSRNVFRTSTLLRAGQWQKNGGWQLTGRTVGIVGLGHVGRDVARLLAPFDCRIIANDIVPIADYCRANGIQPVDKATLFAEADVVTLHCPLTEDTRHLVGAEVLASMKPEAYLVNTARGEIVDQAALKAALIEGRIAGAALDVFESEPPTDLELLALPNLVGTAHIGGNALEAILAMGRSAIGHLDVFFQAQGAQGTGQVTEKAYS